jgi:Ca2+-transporting ATPase
MHNFSVEQVLSILKTDIKGLSQEEAKERLKIYGPNEIEEKEESKLKIFLRQFTSPFIIILMVAGLLAFFLGDLKDGLVVYGLLLINGFIGFYQEIKALASVKALKSLTLPTIRALRDGKEIEINIKELVPGDIVLLFEGDVVPADIRLIESVGLMVDEAILTGESIPVEKNAGVILNQDAPVHERINILFKGTTIVRGKAIGIVFATGENTELGKIAKRMQEKPPESPLTKALGDFGKKWIFVLILILAFLVIIGILQGREAKSLVFFAIAQLVSAVPEGLPIVVTIALVVGAIRLSKEKVLVKHLPAVETLGSATYICSDKTGTITVGKLRVEDYVPYDKEKLYLAAALCNDAEIFDGKEKGDPLEISLLYWLEKEGIDWNYLRNKYEKIWEHPFDTKLRLMAVVVKSDVGIELYIKGALESLSTMCESTCPEEVFKNHDKLAEEGLRVLAFGYAKLDKVPESIKDVKINLVGLVGFLDPPKEGVKESVEMAKNAGIRVIMITGDNLLTAKAIAKMVGVFSDGDIAIEGKDLEKYSDEELYQHLKNITVVARATPEDKYRIVKVLQSNKEIVAVTGDGVNDVPALRVADLGIAMGSGSQAAKDVAKMIITDNNLSIIVNAVKSGRLITKNISKVIRYLLSTNLFELTYNSLAILMALPLPLYATQILWINLVTDGVQDKAYPFTKYEGDPMKEKPKKPEKVFTGKEQFIKVAYNGLIMGISHFFLFKYLLNIYSYEVALTISFTSAVISQWSVGIQEIGEKPFFKNPIEYIKLNPYIYLGIFIGAILQIIAISLIPHYFHAVRLTMNELPYIFIIPFITFIMIELRKWISYLKSVK